LSGVSETQLIDTAYGLLKKNDCDYVLANDMRTIGEVALHKGHLIDRNKDYRTVEGKSEIASVIVDAVARSCGNKER
jgi:hypothetical protein